MTRKQFNSIKGMIDKEGLPNVSYNNEGRGKFFLLEVSDSDKPPRIAGCVVVNIQDMYEEAKGKVRGKLDLARDIINGII